MNAMRTVDAAATAAALPMGALIDALRERFALGCEVPTRGVHRWPDGQGGELTSLVMPAWVPGQFYGVKVINMATGNAARGLPGLHAAYLLFDAQTGVPLALMDGDQITLRRTAAASALAASYLARPDAQELLVVGAGRVAALLPWAYREVRPLRRVRVWARRADQAQVLASRLRAEFAAAHPDADADSLLQFEAVTDLPRAVQEADIISCATLAHEPVVQGAWMRPGQHLDLIGSFTPEMREADDDCLRGASLFVDVREALAKSGELIGPLSRGVIGESDVVADLQALCRGMNPGRRSQEERTVFKSVGTALEDLGAAGLVWAAQVAVQRSEPPGVAGRAATATPPA